MISEEELNIIEDRCQRSKPGMWKSYIEGRDHESGEDFIMTGIGTDKEEDLYITYGTHADLDFIANAKQDIPKLIREIRRLKSQDSSLRSE